jgi:hypothetical protein
MLEANRRGQKNKKNVPEGKERSSLVKKNSTSFRPIDFFLKEKRSFDKMGLVSFLRRMDSITFFEDSENWLNRKRETNLTV